MKTNEERLQELLSHLDSLSYVKPAEIPNIPLYMDQVTTFMEEHLGDTKRYPEDKVLTKTMINNYAKNNLLPPPLKKKYSKEHMLMLIFIYYFKNVLSFNDIEQLFGPIISRHFAGLDGLRLEDIYEEVFSMVDSQMERLKADVTAKFNTASATFRPDSEDSDAQPKASQNDFDSHSEAPQTGSANRSETLQAGSSSDQEYLQLFAFICELSFDVYLKTKMIETLTDQLRAEAPQPPDKHKR
ncbi:MAG: DUF1836 domain-containing protein [Lachnospiraceae bacterium]|nr:DUF1836 domain-containing protein [Lachnospiraceae bacterium]